MKLLYLILSLFISLTGFAQKDSATNAKENIVSLNFGVGIPIGTFASSTGASEAANSPGYAMIGYSANILFEHRHPRHVTFACLLGYNYAPFDVVSYFRNRIQNVNMYWTQSLEPLQFSHNKPFYRIISVLPGMVFTKSNDNFVIDFHALLGIITAKSPNITFTGKYLNSSYLYHQSRTDTITNSTIISPASAGSLAFNIGLTFRLVLSEKMFLTGSFDFTFAALSYSPTESNSTPNSYLPDNWDVGSPISFPVSLFNATIGIGYKL
jgi:hypothetical protein